MTSEMDLSARMRASIHRTLDHLDDQLNVVQRRIDEIKAREEPGFDEELARAGAALSRALKEISGEMRQLERHDRKMILTPEQRFAELLKYVRTLDPTQRKELRAELTSVERER